MKRLINNFIINYFIRLIGVEEIIYHRSNPYLQFKFDPKRTTQENAGYSDRPEINEVIKRSKNVLQHTVEELCSQDASILDIGCGPGMYLELFKNKKYSLAAIDLNPSMIEASSKLVPEASYQCIDFFNFNSTKKFDLIYCIGMLIYIPRSSIKEFIKKISERLEKGGIFYLSYPHASSLLDTWYNDLTYIKYSPDFIEKIALKYFEIIKHEQAFDGRKIHSYDSSPYKSLNPQTDRTYKNSYLLIARKK